MKRVVLFILLALFGLCVILGIVLASLSGVIFKNIFQSKMIIKEGSGVYDTWKNGLEEAPFKIKAYFFNVMNSENDILAGKTPIFKEVGPYTYEERVTKVNISHNEKNGTIEFTPTNRLKFLPDESDYEDEDFVTVFNLPVGVAMGMGIRGLYSFALTRDKDNGDDAFTNQVKNLAIVVRKKVKTILEDGYKDQIILTGENLFPDAPKLPPLALLKNVKEHRLTVNTGELDFNKRGQIVRFDGHDTTYEGCNVTGTLSYFPPGLKQGKDALLFLEKFEATFNLTYIEETDVKGLRTFKYRLDDNAFGSSRLRCYAQMAPMGLFGVAVLRVQGIPLTAYFSQPHFLNGDPSLKIASFGMTPDKDKHDTIFRVEPTTGLPISFEARFQVNVKVEPDKNVFKNIGTYYAPIVWLEKSIMLPDSKISSIQLALKLREIIIGMGCALVAIGIIGGLSLFYFHKDQLLNKMHSAPREGVPHTTEAKAK
jgi:hypothetical protein